MERMRRILIIGLGLIGGSYAMALKRQGYYIIAIDNDSNTIEYALKNNIIDEGTTVVTKEFVQRAQLTIFGLYPNTMLQWIKEHYDLFEPGSLLTDVSGVKNNIVEPIQEILGDNIQFVSAHPMAGKEVYGIENADDAIFARANLIITPTEKNTKEAIETVYELGRVIGFKSISELSIIEHDKMIAFVSQLTHAIAVSLMNTSDNKHLKQYTGDSFRDLTRIAKINEEVWSELFSLNQEFLVERINEFVASLQDLKDAISANDLDKMKRLFIQSTIHRGYFDE